MTSRAIMLTGEWGSGKSFYVKNTLKPFLESEENGNHKCAIISLYGLSDVTEISKAIYMELRAIKTDNKSEAGTTAKVVTKIVGKTLFNGLMGKLGFEIGNISDTDFQEIYNSIDLSNKLIVLEDIERTQINIIDLFGYINNMCEIDGVKILLITNEEEMLTTNEKTDEKGRKIKYYTESAMIYKRIKEKTVGDTVRFVCAYSETIQQIINSFGSTLQKFNNQNCAEDIWDIFILLKSFNFRAFIYACQKSKDIFEFVEKEKIVLSEEIEKIVFYGIIAFAQRQGRGERVLFDSNTYISAELGLNDEYPLFHFCYDYLIHQTLSKKEIINATELYNEYRQNSEWNSGRDKDLKLIKEFYINSEKDIIDAVSNLPEKLRNGHIPYCDYGILINSLIAIRYDARIRINLEEIIDVVLEKLEKSDSTITFENLFNAGYTLHNEKSKKVFESVKGKMSETLDKRDSVVFDYTPESLNEFYQNNIIRLRDDVANKGFAYKLDFFRFTEMLKHCSAYQISIVRNIFKNLYQDKNFFQFYNKDKIALRELSKKCSLLFESENYDKIQKLQLKWFVHDLNSYIKQFDAEDYQSNAEDYRGDWINDKDS